VTREKKKSAKIRQGSSDDLSPAETVSAATEKASETHGPYHHPAQPIPETATHKTRENWKENEEEREKNAGEESSTALGDLGTSSS